MLHFQKRQILKTACAAAMVLVLAACGGEGEDSDAGASMARSSLSGVAAIGAPVVEGRVDCLCASGASATASTASDGSFRLDLLHSDYPCALRLAGGTAKDKPLAMALHSLARSAGTANITPLTDLMVASLSGQGPGDWLAQARPQDLGSTITQARLNQALEDLAAALASLPDQPALPVGFHPMTSLFGAQPEDSADELLENYARALETAGLTQAGAAERMASREKPAPDNGRATLLEPGSSSFTSAVR